ncbi:hypothetical protein V1264_004469 [Littorina saxatilis]|uniref:Uncharacterized protein n=1 Tax=Littorina saxatilis TaxID=31220 RepID=A0AAN9G772_9CAEN
MHGQSSRWICFKFGGHIQVDPGHDTTWSIFQHVLSARSAEPILVPPQLFWFHLSLPGPPYRHTIAATPHHNAKVLGGSFSNLDTVFSYTPDTISSMRYFNTCSQRAALNSFSFLGSFHHYK